MFSGSIHTKWENYQKDKMFQLVNKYKTKYNKKITAIIPKIQEYDKERLILTFIFENENVQICFEIQEDDWTVITVVVNSDDKKLFDNNYDFIIKASEEINMKQSRGK